ncbi:MAG: S8 family serine peptidase [Alphaproteobacteria bacterium]|nr:S8 family serine peptidase [Alphaproteobacteria bacterium]
MELWHYIIFGLLFVLLGIRLVLKKEMAVAGIMAIFAFLGVGLYIFDVVAPDKETEATIARSDAIVTGKAETSPTRKMEEAMAKARRAEKLTAETAKKLDFERDRIMPEDNYEPGVVLVANPPENFGDKVAAAGFIVVEKVVLGELSMELWRLGTPRGMSVPDAIKEVRRISPGALVDAHHYFEPGQGVERKKRTKKKRKPKLKHARGLMGWPKVSNDCGEGLRIGMIDSPVEVDHPALVGRDVEYISYVQARSTPVGTHGTAVASILVGSNSPEDWGGILPGASLYAVNIFKTGKGGKPVGDGMALGKGIDWLLKKQVHAVNLSVASAKNKALNFLFKQALKKGLIMVAAAGNWRDIGRIGYPAALDGVMAVTAVSRKKAIYNKASVGPYIDFAAPGVKMWTAVPGGGKFQSGTSFASPYLTSLVAIEIAKYGKMDLNEIRSRLGRKIHDLGKPGKDRIFGVGLVRRLPNCKAAG